MIYNNPLLDSEFLLSLDEKHDKELYVRITALTQQEYPVEQIEGWITGGSVNLDGKSTVRRSCSLSLITEKININDYNWGLNNKFQLEIGLRNNLNPIYPEIIYFNFGIFLISSFTSSNNIKSSTINLQGKDKMCRLNGEMGGNLPSSVDFGVEEYYDKETNIVTYTKIPIKTIIKEGVHTYANEPYHNIVINDLDEAGLELLEYRGDKSLYLLKNVQENEYKNYTLNGKQTCYILKDGEWTSTTLDSEDIEYDKRISDLNVEVDKTPTQVIFNKDKPIYYTIAKVEYGETVGYRITDLVYAGELIGNIGETFTSILDKIKNMLGDFEYFYDANGRFVFQRKKTYLNISWNNIVKNEDNQYVDSVANTSQIIYNFENNRLISSFANNPVLTNIKNDYSIWGKRTSVSGVELPIHYRYAIDKKPDSYTTISVTEEDVKEYNSLHPNSHLKPQESKIYNSVNEDWREIIYQMALDYFQYNQLDSFLSKVAQANPKLYSTGYTGYEQYYTDLQGFWRELYNPDNSPLYSDANILEGMVSETISDKLYVKGRYKKASLEEIINQIDIRKQAYQIVYEENSTGPSLKSFLNAINIKENTKLYAFIADDINEQKKYVEINKDLLNNYTRENLYIYRESEKIYIPLIAFDALKDKEQIELPDSLDFYYFTDKNSYYQISSFDQVLQKLYYYNKVYNVYIIEYKYQTDGTIYIDKSNNQSEKLLILSKNPITYYNEQYQYIQEGINANWNKLIEENPSALNFWFDFMDTDGELGKYAVPVIGSRAKVTNDNKIKSIYFREIPNLIFVTSEELKDETGHFVNQLKEKTGYVPVITNKYLENLFTISAQGRSAKDTLDDLLYQHTYCTETVNITAIPVYYLQPNTRILIRDELNNIEGEYLVDRIGFNLNYNSTMSISATKAPQRIY